jgi:hypothetical protein
MVGGWAGGRAGREVEEGENPPWWCHGGWAVVLRSWTLTLQAPAWQPGCPRCRLHTVSCEGHCRIRHALSASSPRLPACWRAGTYSRASSPPRACPAAACARALAAACLAAWSWGCCREAGPRQSEGRAVGAAATQFPLGAPSRACWRAAGAPVEWAAQRSRRGREAALAAERAGRGCAGACGCPCGRSQKWLARPSRGGRWCSTINQSGVYVKV